MPTTCECSGHITRVSQRLNQFQSSATAAIVLRTATLTFYCWVLTRTRAGDQGTRGGSLNATKAGIDDALRLSEMLKLTGADGFFGDTISSSDSALQQLYDDALSAGHPMAIQPEQGGTPGALNFSSMGWGYCECTIDV